MDPMTWSVLCCVLMAVVVVLEMFTPSFGMLTLLGFGLIAASVYFAFTSPYGASGGFVMLAVNLVVLPLTVVLAMQFMKSSPLAHKGEMRVGRAVEPETPKANQDLLGQEGRALTALRPSGTVEIGERRIDVISDGKFVEAGTLVTVVRVGGSVIVVEPKLEAEV